MRPISALASKIFSGKRAPLFLAAFMVTALGGWFVQFIALPLIVPQLHYGSGLLANEDSISHQKILEQASEKIRTEGLFNGFELRPEGQGHLGPISLIYAALAPSTHLMPIINGLLIAWAVLIVFRILLALKVAPKVAAPAALIYALIPTNLAYMSSQILKDPWTAPLFLITGLAIVSIPSLSSDPKVARQVNWPLFLEYAIAIALAWVVRGYTLRVIALFGLIAIIVRFTIDIVTNWQKWIQFPARAHIFVLASVFFGLPLLPNGGVYMAAESSLSAYANYYDWSKSIAENWQWSPMVPDPIESQLIKMVIARRGLAMDGGQSALNNQFDFTSVNEMARFIPEALTLGLFAPSPTLLLAPSAGAVRANSGWLVLLEVLLFYIALVVVNVSAYRLKLFDDLGPYLVFLLCLVCFYAVLFPNIGALYRMKLSFHGVIICLGAAFLFSSNFWSKNLILSKDQRGRLIVS